MSRISRSRITLSTVWSFVLGLMWFAAVPPLAVGQAGSFVPARRPAFLYGINATGVLQWYRHNGYEHGDGFEVPGTWEGPKDVGFHWNFKQVFPGWGHTIYAIAQDGTLNWYKHTGYDSGKGANDAGAWEGPKVVGSGWAAGFKQVFSGSDGVIYAIENNGTLRWYRHNGYKTGDGDNVPGSWEGPKVVGSGWAAGFKQVFSGCDGVIYAIEDNGTLRWYRHNGYKTGDGDDVPGSWDGPKVVGSDWAGFKHVSSGCEGVIYAVENNGTLKWYKHNGYKTGDGAWSGPKNVGSGWENFLEVFVSLPETPEVIR